MIKFENTEVVGWKAAIRGMRNPMNSWEKDDSIISNNPHLFAIGNNNLTLAEKLVKSGTDHRKFMRMIEVYVDIIAPLYFYKELDTYRFGVERNSCSTMHTIHKRDLMLDDFSYGYLTQLGLDTLKHNIEVLNAYRAQYINTKNKEDWYTIIQLLPSGYNQKRTYMFSYESLANIYKSRKNHKLDEWREHSCITTSHKDWGDKVNLGFCDWIKTLPYSELITGGIKEKYNNK